MRQQELEQQHHRAQPHYITRSQGYPTDRSTYVNVSRSRKSIANIEWSPLQLRSPLRIPQFIPRRPRLQMRRHGRHMDLVVIAHRIRRRAVLARHPSLDIRRRFADLVAVRVDDHRRIYAAGSGQNVSACLACKYGKGRGRGGVADY